MSTETEHEKEIRILEEQLADEKLKTAKLEKLLKNQKTYAKGLRTQIEDLETESNHSPSPNRRVHGDPM